MQERQATRQMAILEDDDLFARAISGYRDAFLIEHSHLPESERNQLWNQRLSPFLDASGASNYQRAHPVPARQKGPSLGSFGKRARQDAFRISHGSGTPSAKRRVTVCALRFRFRFPASVFAFRSPVPDERELPPPKDFGLTIGRLRTLGCLWS